MRNAKVDGNHRDITNKLRKIGASVQSLAKIGAGAPDLVVGYRKRNYLLEIKDPVQRSKAKLNEAQKVWHMCWRGRVDVVSSFEEACLVIGADEFDTRAV